MGYNLQASSPCSSGAGYNLQAGLAAPAVQVQAIIYRLAAAPAVQVQAIIYRLAAPAVQVQAIIYRLAAPAVQVQAIIYRLAAPAVQVQAIIYRLAAAPAVQVQAIIYRLAAPAVQVQAIIYRLAAPAVQVQAIIYRQAVAAGLPLQFRYTNFRKRGMNKGNNSNAISGLTVALVPELRRWGREVAVTTDLHTYLKICVHVETATIRLQRQNVAPQCTCRPYSEKTEHWVRWPTSYSQYHYGAVSTRKAVRILLFRFRPSIFYFCFSCLLASVNLNFRLKQTWQLTANLKTDRTKNKISWPQNLETNDRSQMFINFVINLIH